jgi:ABC-type multidrug transport system permease subunit
MLQVGRKVARDKLSPLLFTLGILLSVSYVSSIVLYRVFQKSFTTIFQQCTVWRVLRKGLNLNG